MGTARQNRVLSKPHGIGASRNWLPLAVVVPLVAVLVSGCAAVTGQTQGTTPAPSPQIYRISGTISPAADGSGATVTLSGAASGTLTADSSGNYTFTGLAAGTYTIAPSKAGFNFSPSTQSVTLSNADFPAVDFSATALQAGSAVLTWTASSSSVAGYYVYRSAADGGPYTLLNPTPVTDVTFTDNTVQSGQTYFYVTTAVDSNGMQSGYSNQVQALIP